MNVNDHDMCYTCTNHYVVHKSEVDPLPFLPRLRSNDWHSRDWWFQRIVLFFKRWKGDKMNPFGCRSKQVSEYCVECKMCNLKFYCAFGYFVIIVQSVTPVTGVSLFFTCNCKMYHQHVSNLTFLFAINCHVHLFTLSVKRQVNLLMKFLESCISFSELYKYICIR